MKVEEQEEEKEMTIPQLFICPISLELFKDPVTLCTGQTYDRSSIEQWLASGNLTCPVTMQRLQDPTFVPNHALRDLIHRWLRTGRHNDHDQSLQALKQSLESEETALETRLQDLETVRVFSEDLSSVCCLMMIQLGFLPLLLKFVFGRVQEEALTERALVCVVKLIPLSDLECLDFLKEESKIESFLCLFKHGSLAVKASLCRMIAIASASSRTRELCFIMGKTTQLLQEIVFLIRHGGSEEASDTVIEALWGLSCCATNHECLVGEGIVDGLISYVSRERERGSVATVLALGLLEKLLLGLESAKGSFLRNPSGVRALVKRVFEVSDHEGSEGAVGSLMAVCGGSSQAREEAIGAGVLTQLLLLLQSQCSARTKTKARMLLKLLRSN